MNIEQLGSFRTRLGDDGSFEVWARGWRLESQVYALIPMGLSLMFLLAPMGPVMRVGGAVAMLAAVLFVFRMTKPGLLLTDESVTIVTVVRRRRFRWDQVSGFMGERRHDEGRVMLVLEGDQHVPLPGTLDPSELDPYGDEEGEMLSAVDQLNRLGERARAGDLPRPVAPVASVAAPASETGGPSRKQLRAERRELRAALKAVRLDPVPDARSDDEEPAPPPHGDEPRRSLLRRTRKDRAPELTQVAIAEPEPLSVTAQSEPEPEGAPGMPSYFPKPVYIPQAEYAQMLREQKAAEKAAAAAAAELRELADLDQLAEKEEFSDWTS